MRRALRYVALPIGLGIAAQFGLGGAGASGEGLRGYAALLTLTALSRR